MLSASLSKTFAISERFKLNYRLEALNALKPHGPAYAGHDNSES